MASKKLLISADGATGSFICLPSIDPDFQATADTEEITNTCSPENVKEFIPGLVEAALTSNSHMTLNDDGSLEAGLKILFDAFWKYDKTVYVQYLPEGVGKLGFQVKVLVTSWNHSGKVGLRDKVASALKGTGDVTIINEVT